MHVQAKVHFLVAQLGRDCDDFTLHIYASLAEQERKMISVRAKAAADVAKRNGKKKSQTAIKKTAAPITSECTPYLDS